MVNYVRLASTAERLIRENGRDVAFFDKASAPPRDVDRPWRGTAPSATDPTVTAPAVIIPYMEEEIDGTSIKRGDKRMYVAENAATPNQLENFDYVVDDGIRYSIQTVSTIDPGPTRVLYDIQVRQ